MKRRNLLRGVGATTAAAVVGGCLDEAELFEETAEGLEDESIDQLEEEAEETVENVTQGLEQPPGADLEIDADGTITVMSLDPNTEGVKCGPIEGDDPLSEVRTHEDAADGVGQTIEECSESTVVAVSENGNVRVIERL
ncbi:twin-arginine translocation signal domain-containing protein [Natrarchaeobius sp. A-rgal3]|uniref:twin-arginine translocation signal domain-containing protein n=1 Tax=Natrarchaeobius versutus TaxID=1679078 RepID=UPI003510349F